MTKSTDNSYLDDFRQKYLGDNSDGEAVTVYKPATFREKQSELWRDGRRWHTRFIISLLISLAFSFTFLVFGPYELYISNKAYITFSFDDLMLPVAICGAVVFAVLLLVLSLLRGKVYNYAASILFALTISGYIQGNFINLDHGTLDGTAIDWTEYVGETFLNLLIWIAIAVLIFTVLYFSRHIWAVSLQILSVVLIGAQVIALVSLVSGGKLSNTNISKGDYYLSQENIYDVSEEKNVIVFLLDRFDIDYAEEQFELDPELPNKFSGFTWYQNFTGSYSRTFPSVCYLLTGEKYEYDIPYDEYFEKAWSGDTLPKDIKEAGYSSRIYTNEMYAYNNPTFIEDDVDNVLTSKRSTDKKLMLEDMLDLSAYRYMPEAFKPFFWLYTEELSKVVTVEKGNDVIFNTDDVAFYSNLRTEGLTVDENSKGNFIFYHMQGSHDPYTMDEYGNKMVSPGWVEGRQKQTRGDLNMILEYIDELKEKGIYDNTTIIITADHGNTGTMPELDSERVLSLFIKYAGTGSSSTMKISHKQICQDNLRASIASYFGLDTTKYGRTIEEIDESESIDRYFYMSGSNEDCTIRDYNLITYKITGDANDFDNWSIVSAEPMEYPFYDVEGTNR